MQILWPLIQSLNISIISVRSHFPGLNVRAKRALILPRNLVFKTGTIIIIIIIIIDLFQFWLMTNST